jgi:primosomal protein N' (replication factor Y)
MTQQRPAGRRAAGREPAAALPIARVAVDSPLPHLDRPFDYLVPAELDGIVTAGSRVRVRFAGRLIDGWVLERAEATGHDGRLSYLERGVGDEPVLTAQTTALFREIADRWAGTFADVVRLGVPPRHARAEAAVAASGTAAAERPPPPELGTAGWTRYRAGAAFLSAVASARPARAVWNALPGEDWPARIAEAVQTALAAGRGAIVVLPDARDTRRLDAALTEALGKGRHVTISADLGPEARYRRWLAVRRGSVRAVIGNRSAGYAPVADLGLVVVFDDGDDLHAEPRAPYPHARDVAVLRSAQTGAALLIAGFGQTAESAMLLESGWAQHIHADRDVVRKAMPRIVGVGDEFEVERDPVARSARLPALAFRTARAALADGKPVLVQVPRRGYVPALACAKDRTPARCEHCHGPLASTGGSELPSCRWCGRTAQAWSCPHCGGTALRASVLGAARTAEEIGRAFPGVVTRTSAAEQVITDIGAGPALVIATPGAEPVAAQGYGAALLLDGWALLSRPDLRAAEEALRRWCNAVALVASDGQVVINAEAGLAAVQALVRWDPAGHAARELAERAELGFPPVSRMASISGAPADIAELLSLAHLPDQAEELGSVELPPRRGAVEDGEQVRALLRVPRPAGVALAEALHAASAVRSARKSGGPLRIALDPLELF